MDLNGLLIHPSLRLLSSTPFFLNDFMQISMSGLGMKWNKEYQQTTGPTACKKWSLNI